LARADHPAMGLLRGVYCMNQRRTPSNPASG
jgi:hypothetical protein